MRNRDYCTLFATAPKVIWALFSKLPKKMVCRMQFHLDFYVYWNIHYSGELSGNSQILNVCQRLLQNRTNKKLSSKNEINY